MKVAFTGHRPDKLGGYGSSQMQELVRRQLTDVLCQLHDDSLNLKAISGMALGFDTWAAETCIQLGVPFIAAIPFEGQQRMWSPEQQLHYKELLSRAEDKIIVCPGGYEPRKMQIRNVWMVDNCDLLIACWNGTTGGTKNCVDYAKLKKKDILYLNLRMTP